jgi:putative effector of murein hydrolase
VLVATYEDSGQDSKNRQQISEILTTGLSTVRVHMGYEVMTPQNHKMKAKFQFLRFYLLKSSTSGTHKMSEKNGGGNAIFAVCMIMGGCIANVFTLEIITK